MLFDYVEQTSVYELTKIMNDSVPSFIQSTCDITIYIAMVI